MCVSNNVKYKTHTRNKIKWINFDLIEEIDNWIQYNFSICGVKLSQRSKENWCFNYDLRWQKPQWNHRNFLLQFLENEWTKRSVLSVNYFVGQVCSLNANMHSTKIKWKKKCSKWEANAQCISHACNVPHMCVLLVYNIDQQKLFVKEETTIKVNREVQKYFPICWHCRSIYCNCVRSADAFLCIVRTHVCIQRRISKLPEENEELSENHVRGNTKLPRYTIWLSLFDK